MSDSCSYPLIAGILICSFTSIYFLKSSRKSAEEMGNKSASTTSLSTNDSFESRHFIANDPRFGNCVYLDWNATTPVFPEVFKAMTPFLTTCFGNPSSSHVFSRPCKDAIIDARKNIGALINASNSLSEIYFTSCGTESDNRAIDIALFNFSQKSNNNDVLPHVITCVIEHPAVINYLKLLVAENKITLDIVPVNNEGYVSVQDIKKVLKVNTALVTIMHSNNEVGTIQPIREIGMVIKQFNRDKSGHVLFHCDAAQSIGKLQVNVQSLGVDMLTLVGHKFGAPKGIAVLYIKQYEQEESKILMSPLLVGGGQERGLRGGTENVAYIAGLGEAARIALEEHDELFIHLLSLKMFLLSGLTDLFVNNLDRVKFNGPARSNNLLEISSDLKMMRVMRKQHAQKVEREKITNNGSSLSTTCLSAIPDDLLEQLPNTVSVSFKHILSHEILAKLSDKVACSAGSACHSVDHSAAAHDNKVITMSPVLEAMSVDPEFGNGTLRLSFGRHTTKKDITTALFEINSAVKSAWSKLGLPFTPHC